MWRFSFFFFFIAKHKVELPWRRQSLPSLFENIKCQRLPKCHSVRGSRFLGCLNRLTCFTSQNNILNLFMCHRSLKLVLSKQQQTLPFHLRASRRYIMRDWVSFCALLCSLTAELFQQLLNPIRVEFKLMGAFVFFTTTVKIMFFVLHPCN